MRRSNAILSSEKQIVDALSRDDIETFGRLLPDDIVDIDTDGVHPSSEWSRGFEQQKKDGLLFRDFGFEDPKLVRLGPDQVILTAREIIHGLNKGKPLKTGFTPWRVMYDATESGYPACIRTLP
jgi:hypothetical protein